MRPSPSVFSVTPRVANQATVSRGPNVCNSPNNSRPPPRIMFHQLPRLETRVRDIATATPRHPHLRQRLRRRLPQLHHRRWVRLRRRDRREKSRRPSPDYNDTPRRHHPTTSHLPRPLQSVACSRAKAVAQGDGRTALKRVARSVQLTCLAAGGPPGTLCGIASNLACCSRVRIARTARRFSSRNACAFSRSALPCSAPSWRSDRISCMLVAMIGRNCSTCAGVSSRCCTSCCNRSLGLVASLFCCFSCLPSLP